MLMAWVGLIPTWCVVLTHHPPPMSKVHSFLLSQPPILSFNYKYRSSLFTIHGPIPKTTVQAMQGRLHRCLLLIKLSAPVNFGTPALLRILRPKTGGAVRARYFWDFRICRLFPPVEDFAELSSSRLTLCMWEGFLVIRGHNSSLYLAQIVSRTLLSYEPFSRSQPFSLHMQKAKQSVRYSQLPKRLKIPKKFTGIKIGAIFGKLPHKSPQKIENQATREF